MKKHLWIIPIVVAFAVYAVAFNNFFIYDDFVWLQRAKTLGRDWRQMFYPDVAYFDPLVYLMFLADFRIAGLDPRWYHAVDLSIHAVNAFLVYRFADLLTGDRKAALFASVLFASSFAIADAVLWSSSRVDLVSAMFSLGTLILFLRYLRTDNKLHHWLACLTFMLALGAKGTPAVIPLILLWLVCLEKKAGRSLRPLAPFAMLLSLYAALLMIASRPGTAGPALEFHVTPRNLALALDALLIPERYLELVSPATVAVVLAILVTALGLLKFTTDSTTQLRRTGVVILAAALLPMLVLKEFKLATTLNPVYLLASPSHRIYLASIGLALIGGGVLRSLESLCSRRSIKGAGLVIGLLLSGMICFNAFEVRKRDLLWETEGDLIHLRLLQLLDHRDRIVEDGFVGLSNFNGALGFLNPMLKVYFNLNTITTEKVQFVGATTDPEKLKRAERSSFFVMGNDLKIYDLSDRVKELLLLCRQASLNPSMPEYRSKINEVTTQTNLDIAEILRKRPPVAD